jgi:large repetitive protein
MKYKQIKVTSKIFGALGMCLVGMLSFNFFLQQVLHINLFQDALDSLDATRFAEAYGDTSCSFRSETDANGGAPAYNYNNANANWATGATTTPINFGTQTGVITTPFNFNYDGISTNSIGINNNASFSGVAYTDGYNTNLFPNYNQTNTSDFIAYDALLRMGLYDGDQYNPLFNGPNGNSYRIQRKNEIQTKAFNESGIEFFGIKSEFYTPESAPFMSGDPLTVFALANAVTQIHPSNYFYDFNDDVVTVTNSIVQPTNGTVVRNPDNISFSYTPNLGFYGNDSFSFQITDGNQAPVSVTAPIIVKSILANGDAFQVQNLAIPYTLDPLNNDYVEDINTLSITVDSLLDYYTGLPWGSYVINPNKTIDVTNGGTPVANLTYTITNTITGESSQTSASIDVNAGYPAIPVNNSLRSVLGVNIPSQDKLWIDTEFSSNTIYPLQNDLLYDPNSTLTITDYQGKPSNLFTVNPDNSVTIDTSLNTLNSLIFLDYPVIFKYTLTDSLGKVSNEVNVLAKYHHETNYSEAIYIEKITSDITRVLFNTDPRTNANPNYGGYTFHAQEPVGSAFGSRNHQDRDLTNEYSGFNNPFVSLGVAGYVAVSPGNCTPTASDDQFTVTNNPLGQNLNVIGNINSGQYTQQQVASGNLAFPFAGYDYDLEFMRDPASSPVLIESITQPSHGTVSINPDQTIKYISNSGYTGPDSFTYRLKDSKTSGGVNTSNQLFSNFATVNLTVQGSSTINNPPVADNDTAMVLEDSSVLINVLGNDSDPDVGDTISIVNPITTNPLHGTVTIESGQIRYTPTPGQFADDFFTYTIQDVAGLTSTARVDIDVIEKNDLPDAQPDTAVLNENTNVLINVLSNDTDANSGDVLVISNPGQPAHGTVVIQSGKILYTPATNYVGPDSFTYTVSDGHGGFDTAVVNITVNNVNQNPNAQNDVASVNANSAITIDVLQNDSDQDILDNLSTIPLSITAVSTPSKGTASIVNNKVVYTANNTFTSGTDTFTYTVSDGQGGVDTATVTISLNTPQNNLPDARDDTPTTPKNTRICVNVLVNDTDVDNQTLTINSVTNPLHGSAVIENNQICYNPGTDYVGSDTFSYSISDGAGGVDTAVVTVSVTNTQPIPQALQVDITKSKNTALAIGETLTVDVKTSNLNQQQITNVTTRTTFDASKFSLVPGSIQASNGSGPIQATVNGNTITVVYASLAAGGNQSFSFKLTPRVIGQAQINATAQFGNLTSTDQDQAQIVTNEIITGRTGGAIIGGAGVFVLGIMTVLYIHKRKYNSKLKID